MAGPHRIDAFSAEDIRDRTTYRKPVSRAAQNAHSRVRHAISYTMDVLQESCPHGRELSLAFTKLEEAMFWGNAAVARGMGSEGGGDTS